MKYEVEALIQTFSLTIKMSWLRFWHWHRHR